MVFHAQIVFLMAQSLLSWFSLLTDDPGKLRARLSDRPVLVYEPNAEDDGSDDSEEDYRLRTLSGVNMPSIGGGDPMAAVIEKTKDNAFQRRVTIGRTRNNDIVLDDASVSRFHAFFQRDEQQVWSITDAGSRNGTFVAGRRVNPKSAVGLVSGNKVRIGAVQLTFLTAEAFVDLLTKRGQR